VSKLCLGDLDKQFVATQDTYDLYIGDNNKGEEIVFTIGRTGRPEHEQVARRFSKQLERSRRNKDKYRKLLIEIIARSVLLDWVGLIDDDNKKVPCNLENRIAILTDYAEIFTLVIETAGDTQLYRDEEEEEITEKNSKKS